MTKIPSTETFGETQAALPAEAVQRRSRLRGFRVLFYLILLVMLLVAMPVLLANNGRNLLAIAKALNVNLDVVELTFGARPKTPAATPPNPVARQLAWPWLPAGAAARSPFEYPSPANESCDAIGSGAQEEPVLVKHDDSSWECSSLNEVGGSSLFVQMRMSRDAAFSGFRIKFNLGPEGMTPAIGDEAARLMVAGIKPLVFTDAMLTDFKNKLVSQQDFYFLLGYYPISFKREFSGAERYNLILFNRQPPIAKLPRWVSPPENLEGTPVQTVELPEQPEKPPAAIAPTPVQSGPSVTVVKGRRLPIISSEQ